MININSDAAVKFTVKLEKLHRSALPNAVRGTLNKVAFDVKQKTMPAESAREFEQRAPNFFKANSRVEMARGWDIGKMFSTVGFVSGGLKGGNNFAVRDLEQQERGGKIKARSFIATDIARGGSSSKLVRPVHRLSKINRIINSNRSSGNKKVNFIRAAVKAGTGGHFIGNNNPKILWRIDSLSRTRYGIRIRKKPLYSYQDNRSVSVNATGFMKTASLKSGHRMERFYIAEAKRQIERLK